MAHDLTGYHVVAPSTLQVGETFSIGLKALTKPFYTNAVCYGPMPSVNSRYNVSPRGITYMDNVPPQWEGTVTLDGGAAYVGPRSYSFAGGRGPYQDDRRPIRRVPGLSFTKPGTHFLTVTDPATGCTGTSNAVRVTTDAPRERLWWGDLHSQTFFSDGLRCPEELYAFAREEAFLDIFALSDHSESLTDRQWDYFVAVTNDYNSPWRFVTLVGLEWTSREWGHRNVYYPGESGPCLRAGDPVYGRLPELYEIARRHGALVIPHHSANASMGVDWSLGHDPEVERLVEIYSVWGNSERPAEAGNPRAIRTHGGEEAGQHVIDALRMGRRYGFTGGGDIHDGRPGDDLHARQDRPEQYRGLYRQGIMGVWARELTRESVFDALWNRRVYATTNVRVFLKFSIASRPMGSAVRAAGPLPVVVDAASEVPIARMDLVRDGTDTAHVEPDATEFVWETEVPAAPAACYYVRVTRQDGEMAWSSPIWVEG